MMDGDGFGLKKRALNSLEGDGFGFVKRNALDGMRKRALDTMEGGGFGFQKRALDVMDGSDFAGFNVKFSCRL